MTVPLLIVALALAPLPLPLRTPIAAPRPALGSVHASTYGTNARVRPQGARVEQWVEAVRQRSPTVRDLIERIEQSDVIVYLEISHRLRTNVTACVTWMAAAGRQRFVRATFRHDLGLEAAIAMLGHELQHVVEVAGHPEVQSSEGLRQLYTRIGHPTSADGRHWDTADAIAVGRLARLEAAMPWPPEPRRGT